MIGGEEQGGAGLVGDGVELAEDSGGRCTQGAMVEIDDVGEGVDDDETDVEVLDGLAQDFEMIGKLEGALDGTVDGAIGVDGIECREDVDTVHGGTLLLEMADDDVAWDVGCDDDDVAGGYGCAVGHRRTGGDAGDEFVGEDGFAAFGIATDGADGAQRDAIGDDPFLLSGVEKFGAGGGFGIECELQGQGTAEAGARLVGDGIGRCGHGGCVGGGIG